MQNTNVSVKSEVLKFVLLRFLSLHVFDPKLDHPDANVINCMNKKVHLIPKFVLLRFLFLHEFDPELY